MAQVANKSAVIVQHPSNGIVRIILNRPKALNAINVELLEDLTSALRSNADARVIILEGAGDRSFCAGEDLKEGLAPKTGAAEELRKAFNQLQDITRLTSSASAIVIAAVQGFAVGGGAEIALAADFVIGGPAAAFCFPEAAIGLAVTGGITIRLTQLVGLLKAKELLFTGKFVTAEEALKIGLLSEIVDDPKARAFELACKLAKRPAIALAASKASLERAVFPDMEKCLDNEVNVASHCFAQSDAQDAITNFAARRDQDFHTKSFAKPVTTISRPLVHETKGDVAASGISTASAEKYRMTDINTVWQYSVTKNPGRIFLRFGRKDFTFQEFDNQIANIAGGLRKLGILPNDRILVMMQNSAEMVCSWLAANRLGAIWVPINIQLKSMTLARVVKAAEPKLALVDHDLYPELAAINLLNPTQIWIKGSTSTNDLSQISVLGSPVVAHTQVSPATTSAFLYTSGTTGHSKPCALSHNYFINQASVLISGCGLREDDVLYCPFPLYHADATALTIIPAILLGTTAAISARFSATRFWDEIRTTQATVYDFMGATLALTYKQPPTSRDRDHRVRLAWGVPIPSFAQQYEERFGHKLITLYGSVEVGIPIFQDRSQPLPGKSCGRVLSGYQLRIADDLDRELSPNTPGHMLIRSDIPGAFFDGYFNRALDTAVATRNLWFHTGDIGKIDEHGNVFFLGRTKDVIRRRGENINAVEIEEQFMEHADVVVAAALGVPSDLGSGTEEKVKVILQVRKDTKRITEKELWDWAVKNMARFQVPSVVQIVDQIPRTSTGKVEKHGLPLEGGCKFNLRAVSRAAKL